MVVLRFLGRQSSMAPEASAEDAADGEMDKVGDDTIQLLCCASQGDLAGVKSLVDKGVDVNSSDFDMRTALHVAACEGKKDVIEFLLAQGADVNAKDRWGSTPLADARHYNFEEVAQFLEHHGGEMPETSPMRVSSSFEVPEYEIDRQELVKLVYQGRDSYAVGNWRGTKVFVKVISLDKTSGEDKLKQFLTELNLMLKLRHPNVVQFLGAVTQSIPVMLVTEYLPKGDLQAYLLKKKKPLKPRKALKFALDIARGLNYAHEFKPEPVVHGNLKTSNLLRDKAGHLKITDFTLTKSAAFDQKLLQHSGRYMAPELFRSNEYDTKVDVFSFSLIVQEMMEGTLPFAKLEQAEAARSYAEGKRPPFKVKPRYYPQGLKELIEKCWHDDPNMRPTFKTICKKLEDIKSDYSDDSFKACITMVRYSRFCGR